MSTDKEIRCGGKHLGVGCHNMSGRSQHVVRMPKKLAYVLRRKSKNCWEEEPVGVRLHNRPIRTEREKEESAKAGKEKSLLTWRSRNGRKKGAPEDATVQRTGVGRRPKQGGIVEN